jgi:6,7-dimethyl-8-ribityllumazine synthase
MEMSAPILIVEARFYQDIAEEMAAGAVAVLDGAGHDYVRLDVPGTFEVPGAVSVAVNAMNSPSATKAYSGFIALGCVIRGETDHYEHIARESIRALMDLTQSHRIALGFGILTCESQEQAWERAARDQQNKGAAAALACLRMIEVNKHLRQGLR